MSRPDVLASFGLSMRFADVLNVLDSELALSIASSSSVITVSCKQQQGEYCALSRTLENARKYYQLRIEIPFEPAPFALGLENTCTSQRILHIF